MWYACYMDFKTGDPQDYTIGGKVITYRIQNL
jgi:hypothetical protein